MNMGAPFGGKTRMEMTALPNGVPLARIPLILIPVKNNL
jgi:hypothetical protein